MKTVIFDMDGTLLDSSRAIEVSVNNTRRELYGFAPLRKDFIVRTINDPSKNAFLEFYGKTKASAEELAFFEKEFVKNYHEFAVLYEGIDELLRHCKRSGYFVALASNAPAYTLQEILKKTGSRELFDLVVGADEHTPSKPDPAMLLRTIAHSPHKKAIFLGDSKKDELAAIRGAEFLQNLQLHSGKEGEDFSESHHTSDGNLGSSGGNFNAGGDSDGKNFSSDGADFGSDEASALSFKGGRISAKAAADEATAQTAAGKALGVQLNLSNLLGAQLEYLQVNWGFGEPSEISRNAQSVEQAREIIDGI